MMNFLKKLFSGKKSEADRPSMPASEATSKEVTRSPEPTVAQAELRTTTPASDAKRKARQNLETWKFRQPRTTRHWESSRPLYQNTIIRRQLDT